MSTTDGAGTTDGASTTDGAGTTDGLREVYDHLVVGGGSAGCVVARRLAESGASVLLLEAGPDDAGIEDVQDPARWTSLLRGELDWGLEYAPTELVGGRTIGLPRGRVLGGSGSTNAMLWYRGHPSDYDGWDAGLGSGASTRWAWEDVLPFFVRAEDADTAHPGDTVRGSGGPMRLERHRDPHPVALALVDAAAEAGFAVLEDGVAGLDGDPHRLEGASLASFTAAAEPRTAAPSPGTSTGAPTGAGAASSTGPSTGGRTRRWSTARGYLRPDPALGVDLSTLTVLTGSTARRLVLAAGGEGSAGLRCTGVEHVVGGRVVTTRAERGVVLTAGAVETPRLLLASGIGDPADLRDLGVELRVALPGVGKDLQDHPLLQGVNLRTREPLGPVVGNGGGAMLNWRSSLATGPAPDLHAFVVQGRHATAEVAARYAPGLAAAGEGRVAAWSPGLMGSRSRGRLTVRSLEAGGAVELQPRFLTEPDDLAALVEALDTVLALAATRAASAVLDGVLTPDPRSGAGPSGALTRAEKEAFVRMSCSTFFHACGTAAMGTGDLSVVDPALRVRGVDGLRVADASVFPTIPTCNTQAPVVMVAERAAALIGAAP